MLDLDMTLFFLQNILIVIYLFLYLAPIISAQIFKYLWGQEWIYEFYNELQTKVRILIKAQSQVIFLLDCLDVNFGNFSKNAYYIWLNLIRWSRLLLRRILMNWMDEKQVSELWSVRHLWEKCQARRVFVETIKTSLIALIRLHLTLFF